MRNRKIVTWALTSFMATTTVQLMGQQGEGPILLPKKPAAKPAAATLLVMCDLACNWKLDGETKGHIDAGGAAKARVEFGQHVVVAATDDGADQTQQFSEIKVSGQTVVTIELKPVRAARLHAQQIAQEEAARMQDLRDHAGERLKEGQTLYDLKRYEEARPLLQKACDGGNMAGCARLGHLFDYGQGVTQDSLRAISLYEKACDAGEMSGCGELSGFYNNGAGVAQDYSRARMLAKKACDGGDMPGCVRLGYLYDSGQGGTQDYLQERSLYQKACDHGNMWGCSSLGYLYVSGHGVVQDYAQGRALVEKGCEGGSAIKTIPKLACIIKKPATASIWRDALTLAISTTAAME
jgi:TPR repeat protein